MCFPHIDVEHDDELELGNVRTTIIHRPGHTPDRVSILMTDPRTNVSCRRSPGHRRCPGEIMAALEADGAAIAWYCLACGANAGEG